MSAVIAGPPDVTGASVVLPARPEPLRFDPAHAALIVVDMQNAYASPAIGRAAATARHSGAEPKPSVLDRLLCATQQKNGLRWIGMIAS